MLFDSPVFVVFLSLVVLLYWRLSWRAQNVFLLAASYFFYGWWDWRFLLLMAASTCIDYVVAKKLATLRNPRHRRALLILSLVVNFSFLGFFKYYMFAAETLNQLRALVGSEPFHVLQVVLPIGISFYTFHSLTYIIDLYRGHATPAKSFTDFSAFVALFPDLVAGPIIRYKTLAGQLAFREHSVPRFALGITIFVLGFAKKILLANPAGNVADAVFAAAQPGVLDAWVGVLAYAMQIYFDFCGYSDMAVGLGRMLGFEYPKNFDAPYRAESITDFWRRWHISLSSVLRDYLYFPLGGNRSGETRTYINLAVVMLLGGLWHGAKWNFVVWGAYHGLLLICERWRSKTSLYSKLPWAVRVGMTFVLVLLSWVLFRADDLTAALNYFAAMFGLAAVSPASVLLRAELYTPLHVLAIALAAALVFQPAQAHEWAQKPLSWARVALQLPLFAFSLMVMFSQAFNPFLYFQF